MVSNDYLSLQNNILLCAFLGLAFFSFLRVLEGRKQFGQGPGSKGRNVIFMFNYLIFFAALFRTFFFALPYVYAYLPATVSEATKGDIYEDTIYDPSHGITREHSDLFSCLLVLLSEALMALGNWSLYAVFIIIACYWYFMLQKLDATAVTANSRMQPPPEGGANSDEEAQESSKLTASRPPRIATCCNRPWTSFDTMSLFYTIMGSMILIQICALLLVYVHYYSLEHRGLNEQYPIYHEVLLADTAWLSLVAVVVLVCITFLSHRINQALQTIEVYNQSTQQSASIRSTAKAQIRRIYAIMLVANLFFYTRVILEGSLAVGFLSVISDNNVSNIGLRNSYLTLYIALKHGTEVIVLLLELIISTAVKSYDNRRVLPVRQSNYAGSQFLKSYGTGDVVLTAMKQSAASSTSNAIPVEGSPAAASSGINYSYYQNMYASQASRSNSVSESTPMLSPTSSETDRKKIYFR